MCNRIGNSGLCVGIGVGFLRHLHVSNDFVIDIICADFVINTTLSAIHLCAEKYATEKRIPDPEVFHVTSKGFYLTSGNILNIFIFYELKWIKFQIRKIVCLANMLNFSNFIHVM